MTESIEKQREELKAIITNIRARYMEGVADGRKALRLPGHRTQRGWPVKKFIQREIRYFLREVRSLGLLLEDIPNKPEEEIAFLLEVFRKAYGRYRP